MSEKQAKKMRKEMAANKPEVKKAPRSVWPKLVAAAVIIAVAGLGVYATYDKIAALIPQSEIPAIETVADIAETEGMSAEELIEKCEMTELGFTPDTSADDFYNALTIEKYAKFEDMTVEEFKKDYGIEQLPNDTLWQEATMKVPMKIIAEQSGMTFDEYIETYGLSAEITEEMTYEEALAIWQAEIQAEETNE